MKSARVGLAIAIVLGCGDSTSPDGSGGAGARDGGGGAGAEAGGGPAGGGGAGFGAGGEGGVVFGATIPFVYVATSDGQIEVFDLDRGSGALSSKGSVEAGDDPSFLAGSPGSQYLYAIDAGADEVLAFAIDQQTGLLTEIGERQSSEGSGPAYVATDASGRWVFVANYGGGTVAVLPVLEDGSLGPAVDVESPGENPHLIRADLDNEHVYVPCLGSDLVALLDFDVNNGQLEPRVDALLPSGTGPRHLELHPSLPVAYVIGELGDSLTTFDVAPDGALTNPVAISTLPGGVDPSSSNCADLHLHPSERFLYGSNRGHDSIARFTIDPLSGAATAASSWWQISSRTRW